MQKHINKITLFHDDNNQIECKINPSIKLKGKRTVCITDLKNNYIYGYLNNSNTHYYFESDDSEKINFLEDYFIIETYWANLIELVLSKKIIWSEIIFTIDGIYNKKMGK